MGTPVGVPVLTHTCTHNRSVPMSTGIGLVMGTKVGTHIHTHGVVFLRYLMMLSLWARFALLILLYRWLCSCLIQ
jgi:hypothetical protein